MKTYYVYDSEGVNIACVQSVDINEAYKEAQYVTGVDRSNLSVEIS